MNPLALRLAVFLAALGLLLAWELAAPRRRTVAPRLWRWLQNLGLQTTDSAVVLAVNFAVPILAVEAALRFEEWNWGLLHRLDWGYWPKFFAAFVLLDLAIYLQHWAFHSAPALWRLHQVHHTDVDIDASTGVRFHPAEILLSLAIKLAVIGLLGAHFLAVLAFELALNLGSLFTHANVRLPESADRLLRLAIVTPDMHRVHHSIRRPETDSNFGFNLSCWDRLFGTYEPEPAEGHLEMRLGLPEHRDWAAQHVGWLLALPFRR